MSAVNEREAQAFKIRELTRQLAYVSHLWNLSCALVRNCNAVLQAYAGATNFDKEYVELVQKTLEKARAKVVAGEEWLSVNRPILEAMVSRFDEGGKGD